MLEGQKPAYNSVGICPDTSSNVERLDFVAAVPPFTAYLWKETPPLCSLPWYCLQHWWWWRQQSDKSGETRLNPKNFKHKLTEMGRKTNTDGSLWTPWFLVSANNTSGHFRSVSPPHFPNLNQTYCMCNRLSQGQKKPEVKAVKCRLYW